jgi:hypothetical protein
MIKARQKSGGKSAPKMRGQKRAKNAVKKSRQKVLDPIR